MRETLHIVDESVLSLPFERDKVRHSERMLMARLQLDGWIAYSLRKVGAAPSSLVKLAALINVCGRKARWCNSRLRERTICSGRNCLGCSCRRFTCSVYVFLFLYISPCIVPTCSAALSQLSSLYIFRAYGARRSRINLILVHKTFFDPFSLIWLSSCLTRIAPMAPISNPPYASLSPQLSEFATWNLRFQNREKHSSGSGDSNSAKRSGSSSLVSPSTRISLRQERRSRTRSDSVDATIPITALAPGISFSAPATALSSIDEIDRAIADLAAPSGNNRVLGNSPKTSSDRRRTGLLRGLSRHSTLSKTATRDFSALPTRPPLHSGISEPPPRRKSLRRILNDRKAIKGAQIEGRDRVTNSNNARPRLRLFSWIWGARGKSEKPRTQDPRPLRPPPRPTGSARGGSGNVVRLESDFKRHTTHLDLGAETSLQAADTRNASSRSSRPHLPNAASQFLSSRQERGNRRGLGTVRNMSTTAVDYNSGESRRQSKKVNFKSTRPSRMPSVAYGHFKDPTSRMLERATAVLESLLVDSHAKAALSPMDVAIPGTFTCTPSNDAVNQNDYFQRPKTIQKQHLSGTSARQSALKSVHPLDQTHLESHSHTLDLPETTRSPNNTLSYTSSLLAHRLGSMPDNSPALDATYKVSSWPAMSLSNGNTYSRLLGPSPRL